MIVTLRGDVEAKPAAGPSTDARHAMFARNMSRSDFTIIICGFRICAVTVPIAGSSAAQTSLEQPQRRTHRYRPLVEIDGSAIEDPELAISETIYSKYTFEHSTLFLGILHHYNFAPGTFFELLQSY